jgi:hypothetical protein
MVILVLAAVAVQVVVDLLSKEILVMVLIMVQLIVTQIMDLWVVIHLREVVVAVHH